MIIACACDWLCNNIAFLLVFGQSIEKYSIQQYKYRNQICTCSVEELFLINNISFQNWTNDDHVMLFGKLRDETVTYINKQKKSLQQSHLPLYSIYNEKCYFTSWHSLMVDPSSADSANSVQGCFSRVQKANGIAIWQRKQFLF